MCLIRWHLRAKVPDSPTCNIRAGFDGEAIHGTSVAIQYSWPSTVLTFVVFFFFIVISVVGRGAHVPKGKGDTERGRIICEFPASVSTTVRPRHILRERKVFSFSGNWNRAFALKTRDCLFREVNARDKNGELIFTRSVNVFSHWGDRDNSHNGRKPKNWKQKRLKQDPLQCYYERIRHNFRSGC